jgi:hypothetical protein
MAEPELTAPLRGAIHAASLLVSVAAEQGKLDQNVVPSVVTARRRLEGEGLTQDEEIAFWEAYTQLSLKLAPVTVDSILATRGEPTPPNDWRDRLKNILWPPALAKRTTRVYRLWTISSLLVLISIQVFWVWGVTITQDVVKAEKRLQELRLERVEIIPTLPTQSVAQDTNPRLSQLVDEMTQVGRRLDATYASLENWNRQWSAVIFFVQPAFESPKFAQLDQDGKHFVELTTATMFLESLSKFGLPFLFGLLGACAYVLRQLESEIKKETFSSKSPIGYGLRLSLGPLAGVAVGLLMAPASQDAVMEVQEILSLKALGPLGLAFVAGFGVELIFTAMDRIVSAFTRA